MRYLALCIAVLVGCGGHGSPSLGSAKGKAAGRDASVATKAVQDGGSRAADGAAATATDAGKAAGASCSTGCDDGVFCNGVEQCLQGRCAAGVPPTVDDGVACTADTCDEATGRVLHTPDDSRCDDGKFCNGEEHCDSQAGCMAGTSPALDDAIDCTVDSCDEATRTAVHAPMDSLCDDADPCTRDRCTTATGCTHTHDGNACPCTPAGACNPFETGKCTATQSCRPDTAGSACQPLNSPILGEGQACPATADQFACAVGLLCTDFGGGATCARLCPKDTVGLCPSGQACTGVIAGESCVQICRPFPAPCDALAQDCPDAADTCAPATHPETGAAYTGCRPAGPRSRGQTCGGNLGACGHGLVCLSTARTATCREICDPAGSRACSDAKQSCTGLSTLYQLPFCE
jgi:hypothetical protein